MKDWHEQLRVARRSMGLSQGALALRTSLSEGSIRAYELGLRHPSREHLFRLLEILKIDRKSRNEILSGAGFRTDELELAERDAERWLSLEQALDLINRRPWPSFIVNEMVEVLAANEVGMQVMGVTRERLSNPVERNVLVMGMDAALASRSLNWEESVRGMAARFKAHFLGAESIEEPSPYFAAVLKRVCAGDPARVARFTTIWDATPERYPWALSWSYPSVWRIPDIGTMTFFCTVNAINAPSGLDIHDWIPADVASHQILATLPI